MPALDRDHQIVNNALSKDGWTIRYDPLTIEYDKCYLHIDLSAERQIVGYDPLEGRITVLLL